MKTLVICSGGLDSVSLAHIVADKHQISQLVSFDYGQRHRKELNFAAAAAATRRLDVPHLQVDMRPIGATLAGSALTDDIDVPDGHYSEDTMRITIKRSKSDIVREGAAHNTPFMETWSCYKGGEVHCGRCGTGVERREAFHPADVADPTPYADPDYWVQAVAAQERR